jgi:hypothetical protein
MSLNDKILEMMTDYLKDSRSDLDVVEVFDYDEDTESSGGCETCWFEYDVIVFTYKDSEGATRKHTESGTLAELLKYA